MLSHLPDTVNNNYKFETLTTQSVLGIERLKVNNKDTNQLPFSFGCWFRHQRTQSSMPLKPPEILRLTPESEVTLISTITFIISATEMHCLGIRGHWAIVYIILCWITEHFLE